MSHGVGKFRHSVFGEGIPLWGRDPHGDVRLHVVVCKASKTKIANPRNTEIPLD